MFGFGVTGYQNLNLTIGLNSELCNGPSFISEGSLVFTGTKEVCGTGSCGACTVLIDGQPAYSCLSLAATCSGRPITTVEGFGSADAMSDVQRSFCDKDGMMCGFCTPGFVVATHAALDRSPKASLDELKYELSGNFCRCGTYPHVFDAAQAVQRDRARGEEGR